MAIALGLAKKGRGRTEPNPMVGAVIVKNNRIIGKGYHHKAGSPHAEVEAIKDAGARADRADLYVTLEPCNHHGKTPPCTEAIIKAGIKRVFIGAPDPNPSVKGNGADYLEQAGIETYGPVLEDRCNDLNCVFLKNIHLSKPYVYLKLAMTLDGKIATRTGHSQWITSEKARVDGHRLRDRVSAIMVGVGTLIADNPSLTTRLPNKKGRDPIRIILDSNLRTPLDANIFNPQSDAGVIIACNKKADKIKVEALKEQGVTVIATKGIDRVDLGDLMDKLFHESITSILVEGGATVAWSCLEAGIVDRCVFYYAPKIVGGQTAPSGIGGQGVESLDKAFILDSISTKKIGPDIRIEGKVSSRDNNC